MSDENPTQIAIAEARKFIWLLEMSYGTKDKNAGRSQGDPQRLSFPFPPLDLHFFPPLSGLDFLLLASLMHSVGELERVVHLSHFIFQGTV